MTLSLFSIQFSQRWTGDLPAPSNYRIDKVSEQLGEMMDYRAVLEILAFLASSEFFWLFFIYLTYRLGRLWLTK